MTSILYVEDNPQNMRLVCKMLGVAGYQMLEALTGYSGLEMLKQHQPSLILMDINLPDIDGVQVTRQIKSNPQFSHIPIIALTANAMYGDRERFLEAGCDGYLAKPVTKSELIDTIAQFLAPQAV